MALFGKTDEEKAEEARAEEAARLLSTGRTMVSGERTAISGKIVGVYLFRATVAAPASRADR